jgi:hypothetical protein
VALFESAIVQVSAPGTASILIWNPANTSVTTFGALGSVPSGAVLKDLVLINQGTVNIYYGMGVAAAAGTLGSLLPVGGQHTLQGYVGTGGTAVAQVWGNTGTVGSTGAVAVGLASVASVV